MPYRLLVQVLEMIHQKIISNAEMEKIIKANPKGFKIK